MEWQGKAGRGMTSRGRTRNGMGGEVGRAVGVGMARKVGLGMAGVGTG